MIRLQWRSPQFFEEPGLFLRIFGHALCILPIPRAR